ncbi:beta-N-acetylhexosaminidase [Paractinoplanes atraurantiacus]|uniref:beta-N-acetylhexosaminidase n=1 Tax=Paractinoplanes atraurantiacus TaxID=1036182 RepID=A0A285JM90_9ACTN|nr:beta-N-acetylhexosaminidase [Actinoplanes atraurantiacus]SNY61193.1 hexosaminidase [Actinoplanes atraurantiacus]
MRIVAAALLALALPLTSAQVPTESPAIALGSVVPAPLEVRQHGAAFRITDRTVIEAPRSARNVADRLAEALRPATGYRLPVVGQAGSNKISLRTDGSPGYRLTVTKSAITIGARENAGLFAGVQTLRQLLPPAIDAATPQRAKWVVSGGEIVDRPRFEYRGAMLDLARHFHTPAEVKKYIDAISRFKINYLHLHLSDDQGWRIQIDSWPRLTAVGGAPGTGVDGAGGGFLTKADYRDLVRYAADRYVTIIPEIDMPGHVNAAQVAYPELTCDGVAPPPRTDTEVGYSSLCIGKDVTYRFVEDVIRELAALTPGPYLHIGGDEAHATTEADYIAFQQRVLPLVAKYGKTPYGWNEIDQAPAATGAVLQYWNLEPTFTPVHASKVVLSPANRAYLDMKYDPATRLGLSWAAYIEVDDAYGWDPLSYTPERNILGVEAPLWSETLRSIDDIEFMAFPRLAAIAEIGWSARKDWESFRTRIREYYPRWELQGVDFYRSPRIG